MLLKTSVSVLLLATAATAPLAAAERQEAGANRTQVAADGSPSALEQDWLFQADGQPTRQRALSEIGRARQFAARLHTRHPRIDLSRELRELARLEKNLQAESTGAVRSGPANDIYLAVRHVKRTILLKHPAVDFSQVLFIDQPHPRFPKGQPWPYDRGGGYIARHGNELRNGRVATSGGKLVVLAGLDPGGKRTEIGPDISGSYWRPDVSFDGSKVLFCFKPEKDKGFHLYETGIDGRGQRQLTFGDCDDIDPIYLSDGHVMFVSTRCHTYVRCMPHADSYVLARDPRQAPAVSPRPARPRGVAGHGHEPPPQRARRTVQCRRASGRARPASRLREVPPRVPARLHHVLRRCADDALGWPRHFNCPGRRRQTDPRHRAGQ
jgi:hypothetical protein